jgi:hypothetical protein
MINSSEDPIKEEVEKYLAYSSQEQIQRKNYLPDVHNPEQSARLRQVYNRNTSEGKRIGPNFVTHRKRGPATQSSAFRPNVSKYSQS